MGQVIARRGKDIQWMGNRSMEVNGEVKPGIRSKLYLNPARDPAMFRLVEYVPPATRSRSTGTTRMKSSTWLQGRWISVVLATRRETPCGSRLIPTTVRYGRGRMA